MPLKVCMYLLTYCTFAFFSWSPLHFICFAKNVLELGQQFTSNLTGKTYYTKSFDHLDCSTKNVIYGIECTLCGLLYVGETRQALRSRMSQHRYDARDPKYRILYNHFNQPGHDRCLMMKVRIIEKNYHTAAMITSNE